MQTKYKTMFQVFILAKVNHLTANLKKKLDRKNTHVQNSVFHNIKLLTPMLTFSNVYMSSDPLFTKYSFDPQMAQHVQQTENNIKTIN